MDFDYKAIGLKAGLECHQQLDTGKLFCRCPSMLKEEKPDFTIVRKLRPVASELGEFDATALEAFRRNLSYVYEAFRDVNCLVELDEEPPMPLDSEALETTLAVSLLAKARVLDEIVVMRKAVIDGSNTSGFQRTALVAVGGKLDIGGKEIRIQTIAIEEDAARPMGKSEKETTYRLDRLGIPLIELATAPELFSPEEVKKAALAVGALFRITGKAKRGLGTIRQDINISIRDGARVEIKGVQELELIDEYVRREAQRQLSLIEIKKELLARGISEKDLVAVVVDASSIFEGTECKFLRQKKAFGTKLKGFAGILGKEIQPDRRFGTELASCVKARTGLQGILHSDELPAYGVSQQEKENVSALLGLEAADAFALVCAEKQKAETALNVVVERCSQALKGVPEETRGALENCNTEYQRPLPGAARMYPETDLKEIFVEAKLLKKLSANLPLWPEQRKHLYIKKFGLSEQLAEKMKLDNNALFFESLVAKGAGSTATAWLLLEGLVQLKRNNIAVEKISDEMLESVVFALKKKQISKDIVLDLLSRWSNAPQKKLAEIVSGMGISKASDEEIRAAVKKVIDANRQVVSEKKMGAMSALMGDLMKELRGKASGEQISRILKEEIAKAGAVD